MSFIKITGKTLCECWKEHSLQAHHVLLLTFTYFCNLGTLGKIVPETEFLQFKNKQG